MKLAAFTGAGLGLGGGLGVLLPACSSSETITISGNTPDTSAAATTSTAELSAPDSQGATSAISGSEGGRPIKLGYAVPITGALSPFAAAARWSNEHFTKAIGDGIVCGDKKKHPVEVVVADTQSDAARAAGVAGDLIQNSKVDLLMTAVTADTVIPAQTVAESFGCPCIANWSEWHADILQRKPPAEGFEWTYVYDFDDIGTATNYVAAFSQVDTNERVGLVLANDLHGNSWAQFAPPVLSAGGYTIVKTDQYSPGSEDYTAQISLLKREGCEIMVGAMLTPDFANFWQQAHQQGFKPKVVCVNKALTFPEAVTAMGDLGNHLCCDVTITPRSIWIDSLTGMTTRQLCDEYEAFSGQQWTEAQLCLVIFEWANDILKRVTNVDDREAYVAAIKGTKLDCSLGTIDFTAPVAEGLGGGKHRPHPNVCTPPQGAGQWVKATEGEWLYDKVIIAAYDAGPGYNQLPIEAEPLPIEY